MVKESLTVAVSPYAATMPQFVRDGVPTLTGFRRESIARYVVLVGEFLFKWSRRV